MTRRTRNRMERIGAVLSAWDKVYAYLCGTRPNTARADVLAAERVLSAGWNAGAQQRLLVGDRRSFTDWRPEDLVDERARLPKSMAANIEAVQHILELVSHLPADEAWWAIVLVRREICDEYLWRTKKVA